MVKKTLEFAEKYADGLATKNELNGCAWGKPGEFSGVVMRKAWDAAEYCTDHASGKVECESRLQDPVLDEQNNAMADKLWSEGYHLGESHRMADAASPSEWVEKAVTARRGEQQKQSTFLRDIFGNPFRLVTIEPAWLTWHDATIPKIAQTICAEHRFADMPLLADALEEAGCIDADILNHCRQPSEHVRGCWVVDLLLGKA